MSTISDLIEQKPGGVFGIDPGLSGAAVVMVDGILYAERDFKALPDIAKGIKLLLGDTCSLPVQNVVIEAVHAMPGQGVCSMFSFGTAYGVAQAAVWTCCSLPVTFVSPQKWQNWFRRIMGIPKGQPFDSRAIAIDLFPGQPELFKRKKDHNTADAALMAVWGLATL